MGCYAFAKYSIVDITQIVRKSILNMTILNTVNNFMIGQLLGVQSPEKQRLLYNTARQKVLNASSANRKLTIL